MQAGTPDLLQRENKINLRKKKTVVDTAVRKKEEKKWQQKREAKVL